MLKKDWGMAETPGFGKAGGLVINPSKKLTPLCFLLAMIKGSQLEKQLIKDGVALPSEELCMGILSCSGIVQEQDVRKFICMGGGINPCGCRLLTENSLSNHYIGF